MNGFINFIYRKLIRISAMPTKIITLKTGVICYHYKNGNIIVIGYK